MAKALETKQIEEKVEKAFASVQSIKGLSDLTRALWLIPCYIPRDAIEDILSHPFVGVELVDEPISTSPIVGTREEMFNRKMDFQSFRRFVTVLRSTAIVGAEGGEGGVNQSDVSSYAETLLQSVSARKRAHPEDYDTHLLDSSRVQSSRPSSGDEAHLVVDPLELFEENSEENPVSWADVAATVEEEFGIPRENVLATSHVTTAAGRAGLGLYDEEGEGEINIGRPKQLHFAQAKKVVDADEMKELLEDGGASTAESISEADVHQLAHLRAKEKKLLAEANAKKRDIEAVARKTQRSGTIHMGFSELNLSDMVVARGAARRNDQLLLRGGSPKSSSPKGSGAKGHGGALVGQHPTFDFAGSHGILLNMKSREGNPLMDSSQEMGGSQVDRFSRSTTLFGNTRSTAGTESVGGESTSSNQGGDGLPMVGSDLDQQQQELEDARRKRSNSIALRRRVGLKPTGKTPPYERMIDRGLKGHCYISAKPASKEEWNDFLIRQADMERAKVSKAALEKLRAKQERDRARGKDMSGWHDPVPKLPTLDASEERSNLTPSPSSSNVIKGGSPMPVVSQRAKSQQLVPLLTASGRQDVDDYLVDQHRHRKRLWKIGGPTKRPDAEDGSNRLVVEPESLVQTIYFKAQKAALIAGPDSEFQQAWRVPKKKKRNFTSDSKFSEEF